MSSMYIISTQSKANKNKYKVGIHSKSINELLSRYRTSLLNPILYYYFDLDKSAAVERSLKVNLLQFRLFNNNDRLSEWFNMELDNLIWFVHNEIDKVNIEAASAAIDNKTDDKVEKNTLSRKDAKAKMFEELAELKLSKFDIPELITKQARSELDATEKLALKKYYFMKTLGLFDDTNNRMMFGYLEQFLDKEYMIYRYELLFGYKELNDVTNTKEKVRLEIVINLVRLLTNKKHVLPLKVKHVNEVKLNNEQYNTAMRRIYKHSLYFNDEAKYRALLYGKKGIKYNYGSKTAVNPWSDAKFKKRITATIQSVLDSYNIKLRRNNNDRKQSNKKRGYGYILSIDKQIKDIIDNKYADNINLLNKNGEVIDNVKKPEPKSNNHDSCLLYPLESDDEESDDVESDDDEPKIIRNKPANNGR